MKPFDVNHLLHRANFEGNLKMKKSILFNTLSIISLMLAAASAQAVVSFDVTGVPLGTAPQPVATSRFVSSGNEFEFFAYGFANKYQGNVDAYGLNELGGTRSSTPVWRAATNLVGGALVTGVLDAQDPITGRNIATRKAGVNTAFTADNFAGTSTITTSNANPAPNLQFGATLAGAKNVINFLRGDQSNEKTTTNPTGTLRERISVLGDIAHSSPILVGDPVGGDGSATFATFRNNNKNRARRLYVGANDGMLHAFDAGTYDATLKKFDAGTGQEVFAYIPSMLIPRLKNLSDPAYSHQYFVDGALASADVAFANSSWHTVLVGTLGAGGKGIFALDVTDPTATSDAQAASKILWEITPASAGFGDLGDAMSDPVLAKMNNGKWAVIVGNGYNSASGKAVLYVIDAETGTLIKAIQAGDSTTSGLSSPAAYDNNGNGTADFVYAGDIEGKLWRFNLSATTEASWVPANNLEITSDGSAQRGLGAVTSSGVGQPIVGAPAILPHPQGGLMINFVTGAYFSSDDKARWDVLKADVQNYAYGVWDGTTNKDMVLQNITRETFTSTSPAVTAEVMVSSANAVDFQSKKGWVAKLPLGASVPSNGAYIANGRFTFTMSNPAATDANQGNWLTQLNFLTGGPAKVLYDLNQDDVYDVADTLNTSVLTGSKIPVSTYLNNILISQPIYITLGATLDNTLYTSYQPGTTATPPASGLAGGHFDTDVYDNLGGAETQHIHRYSDKYSATGVNFLNAGLPTNSLAYTGIGNNNKILPWNVGPPIGQKFFVIVANADQSALASVRINNDAFVAPTYPNAIVQAQRTLNNLTSLKAFQVEFPRDVLTKSGLFPVHPSCVKSAGGLATVSGFPTKQLVGGIPGKLGEWRNGALTLQVLKDSTPASAIRLNVANRPEKGYVVTDAKWLLREYTVYWHSENDLCNTDPGWTASPGPDVKVVAPITATPSMDPGNGNNTRVIAITTSTSSTPPTGFSTVSSATSYTSTTTIYSNKTQIVTVTARDGSGNILGTTSQTSNVTGGGGGGDAGGLGNSQTDPNPNTKITGRVNWTERFRTK